MEFASLQKQFARMGARVTLSSRRHPGFAVDIGHDRRGSLFELAVDRQVTQVSALDVQPASRHLLLVVRRGETHKYLCGHDERDWFAAAVPGSGGVANVRGAFEALKPVEVRQALVAKGVRRQHQNRRRNAAFVRQGEWFFIPEPDFVADPLMVLHNEPLSRGRGKAHWVEFLCRSGGRTVYVSREYPRGLSEADYRTLLSQHPEKRRMRWAVMRADAAAYARGRVRHPDHKTIRLDVWHRVLMNTEHEAPAMRHLMFLD
jgi:hypothetical protein